MNSPPDNRLSLPGLVIGLLLAIVLLVLYRPVRQFDFVDYDDHLYVTDNRIVQQGLTGEGVIWAFTTLDVANWQPITWLSHMLDCQLYGLNPAGHHWTSVFFHIANSLLLFWILNGMTGSLWKSAFAASLFALHPLQVESVAWIAERKNVLSTFFGFLTIGAYCRYAERKRLPEYLVVFVFLSLGLMAKPMLVTFPFVLLLLDIWPLQRLQLLGAPAPSGRFPAEKTSTLILEKIPLFIPAAIVSFLTVVSQKNWGAMGTLIEFPFMVRVVNAVVAYAEYIAKAFWPINLSVFYPHPGHELPVWKIAGAVVLIAGTTVVAFRLFSRNPYILIGWLFYLGTLVPVIGIVQVGEQAVADRYCYIPLIGIFIIVSWGGAQFLSRHGRRTMLMALSAGIVLTALFWRTHLQVPYWENSILLFRNAVEVTENNWVAHNNLGAAYANIGQYENAVRWFRKALEFKPDFIKAHYGLATASAIREDYSIALKHFKEALEISPSDSKIHNNLGNVYYQLGQDKEAEFHYLAAIRIEPLYPDARYNLGTLYFKQGQDRQAMEQLAEVIRLQPENAGAYNKIGLILVKMGNRKGAEDFFSQAIRINPEWMDPHNNLRMLRENPGSCKE